MPRSSAPETTSLQDFAPHRMVPSLSLLARIGRNIPVSGEASQQQLREAAGGRPSPPEGGHNLGRPVPHKADLIIEMDAHPELPRPAPWPPPHPGAGTILKFRARPGKEPRRRRNAGLGRTGSIGDGCTPLPAHQGQGGGRPRPVLREGAVVGVERRRPAEVDIEHARARRDLGTHDARTGFG
jgi:hypothetical protein